MAVEAEREVLSKIREERPHLVILDCTTDLDLLQRILSSDDLIKVIVVAEGRNGQALRAIRMGAFDACRKPVDPEELRIIVQRALHIRRLEEENPTPRTVRTKSMRPNNIAIEWTRDASTNTFSYEIIVR